MNKHKSNKIKENSNTVRHLIMGQIITTQNLVAIKEVRHAGQSLWAGKLNVHHIILQCGTPQTTIYACAWFLCHVFVCILISVWVFCYTTWHVHFLTLDASEHFFVSMLFIALPALTYSSQDRGHIDLYDNQLDVLCLPAHYQFYLHTLWTYSQWNRDFDVS